MVEKNNRFFLLNWLCSFLLKKGFFLQNYVLKIDLKEEITGF